MFCTQNAEAGSRCKTFRSQDMDEARSIVSEIFADHVLRRRSSSAPLEFNMRHAPIGRFSSINHVSYGGAIDVIPGRLGDIFNVQIQIRGNSTLISDGQRYTIPQGCVGMLSPEADIAMEWEDKSAMLIYCVSRAAMERTLRAKLGIGLVEPLKFDPYRSVESGPCRSLHRTVKFIYREMQMKSALLTYPEAVEHLEQSLIISLLYSHPHNYSQALANGLSPAAPVYVRKAEEYIRKNYSRNITIEDLAGFANVSARSLYANFSRFRGISPMQYLRSRRLDAVRERLSKPPFDVTITEVAMDVGFSQMGRFAGQYKDRFGETPSETLHRAKREVGAAEGHLLGRCA